MRFTAVMTLSVKYIKPVTWNKTALERIVMQVKRKRIIKSAVWFHLSHQHPNPVPDHENGLAILPHGPPGTGKTLTAKAVAELYERPLFFVSGDSLRNRHLSEFPRPLRATLEFYIYHAPVEKARLDLAVEEVYLAWTGATKGGLDNPWLPRP